MMLKRYGFNHLLESQLLSTAGIAGIPESLASQPKHLEDPRAYTDRDVVQKHWAPLRLECSKRFLRTSPVSAEWGAALPQARVPLTICGTMLWMTMVR